MKLGNFDSRKFTWEYLSDFYPGVVVSVLLAIGAYALSAHYGAPVMLFALLLGMAVNFLGEDERCAPGISFCAKVLLRTGVALLGLRITVDHLIELGWMPAVIVVVAVVVTTALGVVIARSMRLTTEFGLLTGGSVAICGASAAIAISTVLPWRRRAEQELAFAIIGVTTLSTIAMVLYPTIADFLDLDDTAAGVFLGGAIHDVAQVIGAGYSISDRAGDLATIVKLLRVAMLVPVVFVVMLLFRQSKMPSQSTFPVFLWVFIGISMINSIGLIPEPVIEAGNTLSRWCLVVAISAVGARTVLREVVKLGWKPMVLLCVETVIIAAIVLGGYIAVLPSVIGS